MIIFPVGFSWCRILTKDTSSHCNTGVYFIQSSHHYMYVEISKNQQLSVSNVKSHCEAGVQWQRDFIFPLYLYVGIGLIASGQADAVIAGGVETMSDVPIRWGRKLRQMALKMNRTKGVQNQLSLLFRTLASKPALLEVCTFNANGDIKIGGKACSKKNLLYCKHIVYTCTL